MRSSRYSDFAVNNKLDYSIHFCLGNFQTLDDAAADISAVGATTPLTVNLGDLLAMVVWFCTFI